MARYGNNDYRPEYDELIIDVLGRGDSLAHFCKEVGTHRGTVYRWIDRYPKQFGEAYKFARELGCANHIDEARSGMFLENFNADLFKYIFSRRYGRMLTEQNMNTLFNTKKVKGKKDGECDPTTEILNIQKLYLGGEIDIDEMGKLLGQVTDKIGIRNQADLQERLERLTKLVEDSEREED